MRILLPLLLLLLALTSAPAAAQSAAGDEAAVKATVRAMFDAMRASDGEALRRLFHPDATLKSVGVRDGVPVVSTTSAERFIEAAGAPHEEVWDERITEPLVRIDGDLATAWMDYAFYLGDRFSHCGVNAFQLFRSPEGWQVIQIADTRRQEQCAIR